MKLTIEREAFLGALTHVQSVVERRNTIPILSNVLIEADGGEVKLTATDLELAVVARVDAEVGQPGATTTAVHTLYDIVRKLPDGSQVELAYDGEKKTLDVTAGRSKFDLSCLDREDFPALVEEDLPHQFEISAEDLKRLIDKSRFAICTEETRYYLNGIYLHAARTDGVDMLRAVATDGHRLARVDLPLPAGASDMPGVIVPRKAVNELRKLMDEYDGLIAVALSETKIRFSFAGAVLSSKLIDGTFPDYDRVIPDGNDKILEVDNRLLAKAVDRVSTISTDKSRAVKLTMEDDRLTLSATSPDAGSGTEELDVSYAASALEVGFNSRYLLDISERVDGELVRLQLSDAGSPTVVLDSADDGALYVLMPMRV